MSNNPFIILFIIITIIFIRLDARQNELISELHQKLLSIPDISVKSIKPDSNFAEAFEIFITQPVDHLNPNSGPTFTQQVYLRHVAYDEPMIFNNEVYATRSDRRTELAKILNCNEIFVEHRYFGESKPDTNLGWKYLTTAQAAADHNRIVKLFKSFYKGKWISTGISKGGQATIFFKYYYPDAVDVWIPYVAPLNLEQEDRRILSFLNNVGTEYCRNNIKNFQRAVLKNRDKILPLLKAYREEQNYTFKLGLGKTLEYTVFEYDFSFWQWGKSSCEDIPDTNASPDSLFKHLSTVSSFGLFGQKSIDYYKPFYYQAYTEMGYYGYQINEFSDLLNDISEDYASSIILAPKDAELNFDNALMNNINAFIQEKGNNMLFIYGELDTWSASAVNVGSETNAIKMVKKGGNHKTRINSFEGEERELIYSTLENWLEVKIER